MRVTAISNRQLDRAVDVFKHPGYDDVVVADSQRELDDAALRLRSVVTADATLLAGSDNIDVLVDVDRLS